ncbi:50S ribosomal protein L29 [Candidatus Gottesmanbacteria bacterium]|nr:50S ribosomal protein L29 [Candidatus Gottesmanbacteria bacterium]
MKKKEKTTLAALSREDAIKELALLKKKLATMRLERFTKQMKNTREGRQIRKKIAVIQTFMRQKELTLENQ